MLKMKTLVSNLHRKVLISSSIFLMASASLGFAATPALASTVGDFKVTLRDGGDPEEGVDYTWSDNDSQGATLTIISENPMIIENTRPGEATNDHIVVNPGEGKTAHLVLNGVDIETNSVSTGFPFFEMISVNPFLVSSGGLELTLAKGSSNSLKTTSTECSGLQNGTNELIINGSGALAAQGGPNGAGIGYANITICESVHVSAIGGAPANGAHGGGAGIGSAASGSDKPTPANIRIRDDAVVTATGGTGAAGIGASRFTSVDGISIEGNAQVTATGTPSNYGDLADIGSPNGAASNIVVSGGYIDLANGKIGGGGSTDGVSFRGGYAPADSYGEASPEHPRGTVYGVDVADGYLLTKNDDPAASGTHPYVISNPTGDYLVTGGTFGATHSFQDGVLTVKAGTDTTVSMAPGKSKTSNRMVLAADGGSGGSVTLNGVSIGVGNNLVAIEVKSGAWTINLAEASSNTVSCGECAGGFATGISVDDGSSLTIEGPGDASGKLEVTAARTSNGIWLNNSGNLIVNSGSLEARGGGGQSGIGGKEGSQITINGGTVKAVGAKHESSNGRTYNGAGIGGNNGETGCDIVITGGTVEAEGAAPAAGIGGGYTSGYSSTTAASGGSITISGGYVRASSIGAASGGKQTNPLSITGGAFARGSSSGNGSVYRIAPADGYVVRSNGDDLASEYPYRVYPSKDASITFSGFFETQTYDGSEVDTAVLAASAARGSQDATSDLSYLYRTSESAGAWSAGLPIEAGTYQVKATLPEKTVDGVVYPSCETVASATLTISQAPLVVSAEDEAIVFGDDAPASASYAITASGWQGDDEGRLHGELAGAVTASCSYNRGDNAGSYAVSLGWADGAAPGSLANYSVQFSDASLTVSKAALASVSIEDVSKKYDGAQVAEPSVTAIDGRGHASDGTCSYAWYRKDGQDSWTELDSAPSQVGSYKVEVSVAEGTNHLPASRELEFSIGRADAQTISVSKIDAAKTYDGVPVSVDVDKAGYDGEAVLTWYESDGQGGWREIDGAPSDAGSYRLVVSADQTDTQESPIIENGKQDFAILRASQSTDAVESGAVVSPESISGGDNGCISGLPGNAEWRASGASPASRSSEDGWNAVPAGGSITGLAPGAYEVRLAGDRNHNPSDSVVLTVASFSNTHGGIVFPEGTSDSGDGIAVLPPDGGEIAFPDGEKVMLPGNTVIDSKTPSATTPSGSIISPDGDGSLSVELPDGAGSVNVPSGSKVNEDGSVDVSGGSATLPDGSVVESSGSITVGADGSARVPDGGSVILPDGSMVSSGGSIEIGADGTVTLPDGGSVVTPGGQVVQVGSATTVSADGSIHDPNAKSDSPTSSAGSADGNDQEAYGPLPQTGEITGAVLGVLVLCACAALVAGLSTLRGARRG